jgi:lipopolysaccharide transport system ATP-binding protein
MSSNDIAVSVRGLSKSYTITHNSVRHTTLGEAFLHRVKNPFARPEKETFWALKDVSFDIKKGDVVGIIGRNGAGKSTLLKILSRITKPTKGEVRLYGRVGSLLEVGTGFHPELTGRENIYLNGAILGMRKREIDRQFDAIVDFASVEQFLDTPVKRYSSGMYVRLAFAVAAHLNPEILVVDEVLAVGDAEFQKKCLGKMKDVASSGRTVLFVSHNMDAVRSHCGRAIWLRQGQLCLDGDVLDVTAQYINESLTIDSESAGEVFWMAEVDKPPGCEEALLRGVRLIGPSGKVQTVFDADKNIHVEIYYEIRRRVPGARFNLHLLTAEGERAFSTTDCGAREEAEPPGLYKSVCLIPGGLLNHRNYVVEISFYIPLGGILIPRRECLRFSVTGTGNQGPNFETNWPGVVCPKLPWKISHVGEMTEVKAYASAAR